jgi:class 3 adenylate cyclase
VLFSDFKGFTSVAELLSPEELVQELDECFRCFDSIVDKYGLEKIKTIGDAYMCAGGLPEPSGNPCTGHRACSAGDAAGDAENNTEQGR